VLKAVLESAEFGVVEVEWSKCVSKSGFRWQHFSDPLLASSNQGTLLADWSALQSALRNGNSTDELRRSYDKSVAVAEAWAKGAVPVDRACREPHAAALAELIGSSR
jgi:hypothetical protein